MTATIRSLLLLVAAVGALLATGCSTARVRPADAAVPMPARAEAQGVDPATALSGRAVAQPPNESTRL